LALLAHTHPHLQAADEEDKPAKRNPPEYKPGGRDAERNGGADTEY